MVRQPATEEAVAVLEPIPRAGQSAIMLESADLSAAADLE
jgi:hypothetical protein